MTEWAEDAGFSAAKRDADLALDALRSWEVRPEDFEHGGAEGLRSEIELGEWYADGMRRAHPIVIAAEQVVVLPSLDTERDRLFEWLRHLHLPFDPLYIGYDPPLIWTHETGDGTLAGALITRRALDPYTVPHIAPIYKTDRGRYGQVGYMRPEEEASPKPMLAVELSRAALTYYLEDEADEDIGTRRAASQVVTCTRSALQTLYFLESANVAIEEREVSRQVRRRAEREGKRLAYEVRVKQGPRTRPVSRGGKADYAYRFEVRGHYKHYGEDTKLAQADPSKLAYVPGRGMCRRIWCPPFVKGPPEKPLVQKVRKIA